MNQPLSKKERWWIASNNESKRRSRRMKVYYKRDKILASLGYFRYSAYLKSDLWEGIRERVLERDGSRCFACNNPATQVHHKRYTLAILTGESLEGMVAICGHCHEKIEFDNQGRKTTPTHANHRLKWRKRRRENKQRRKKDGGLVPNP